MSAAHLIKEYVREIPIGEPFSAASLRNMAAADNARQILNRMVKNNEIKRVCRGVFVKPEINPYIGEIIPEAEKIVTTIANSTGEKIFMHGSEAARILNLTTQMSMTPIFYTTGTTREVKTGEIKIILKHISPRKLVETEIIIKTVILALWYLGKNNVSVTTINTIEKQLGKAQFKKVIAAIAYMPAWMANIFYQYKKGNIK